MSILSSIRVSRYNSFVGICIAPTESPQRSFHIAFLLDVSGSMAGERLSTVKRTLQLFVEQMHEEDSVSIITYSGSANVLCRGAKKADIPAYVDQLKANGGTNMEAGILALPQLDLSTVDAVFLLTDGEVNQGIRSISGLDALIRMTVFGPCKIPVYTLGYGSDHNAKLLQVLAVNTRASYTFAETNEMIPSVVGSILVAMRDEVAKGVTVEWISGATAAESTEVVCCEPGCVATDNSYCVGSVIANKPQWVILKGSITALRLRTSNSDPVELPLPAETEAADEAVLEQSFRAEAARVFTEVTDMTPMSALPKLQALEDDILASPVLDRPLLLRIRAQIAEQREFFDAIAAIPAMPANAPLLTRFVSNAAAFATQRGDMPEFNSPAQRMVSATMVAGFSQDPAAPATALPLPLPLPQESVNMTDIVFPPALRASATLPAALPKFLRRM